MQSGVPPNLQVCHVENDRWAVLGDERQVLYSGTLVQCEDWLDDLENLQRLDDPQSQIGWAAIAARLPVGAAYLILAALALPIRAAGRLVTGWRERGDGACWRDRPLIMAFELRRTMRRTWRWIFNDSPAPWGSQT